MTNHKIDISPIIANWREFEAFAKPGTVTGQTLAQGAEAWHEPVRQEELGSAGPGA